MTSELSKTVSTVLIRLLNQYLLTVVVKFSPPPGISQRFLGQVPFGGAVTRMSFLDRSNSGGGTKFDNHGNFDLKICINIQFHRYGHVKYQFVYKYMTKITMENFRGFPFFSILLRSKLDV